MLQKIEEPCSPFNPWLIQRLQPSNGGRADGPFNPIGFQEKASKLLGQLFSFDYMGSSEFEWGAIPKCLKAIAECAEDEFCFATREIEVTKPRLFPREEQELGEKWQQAPNTLMVPVHFLGPDHCFEQMVQWVAENDATQIYPRLKEMTRFQQNAYMSQWRKQEGMEPDESYGRCIGWLEISYGVFYFIDKDVFDKTCALFGIQEDQQV